MPEVRPLPPPALPGLNSLMDLSDSPSSRHQPWRSELRPPPDRASPDNSYCLASVLCPLPRRIRKGPIAGSFPIPRGLPRYTVGSASAPLLSRPAQALHVTAHWLAQPPKATFVTGLQPARLPAQAACQLLDQPVNYRDGIFLHWQHAPSGRTMQPRGSRPHRVRKIAPRGCARCQASRRTPYEFVTQQC